MLFRSGELLQRLINLLAQKGDLEVWTDNLHVKNHASPLVDNPQSSLPYIAPEGMNVMAKFLAQGLEINRGQRVKKISLNSQHQWHLTSETNQEFTASSVVVAIPAPQAVMLLESLSENILDNKFLEKLRGVEYNPAITVMAGYPNSSQQLPEWKAIAFKNNPVLGWIGLDSSKRKNPIQPHFVIHSSADFAEKYFESEDLQQVGREILEHAAINVNLSWLNNPEWIQVHRWRYAFPKTPLQQSCLPADISSPLVFCGDWCGGNLVESAIVSGIAAAEYINSKLQQRELPGINFVNAL